ncbi:hypothetical protein AKJ16_DCAP08499 [Drosera capensis]
METPTVGSIEVMPKVSVFIMISFARVSPSVFECLFIMLPSWHPILCTDTFRVPILYISRLYSFLPRCFEVELIMVDDVIWLISSLCILKGLLASFAPPFHLHALLIKGGKLCSIACARSCPGGISLKIWLEVHQQATVCLFLEDHL